MCFTRFPSWHYWALAYNYITVSGFWISQRPLSSQASICIQITSQGPEPLKIRPLHVEITFDINFRETFRNNFRGRILWKIPFSTLRIIFIKALSDYRIFVMLGGELPIASCVQGVPGEVPIKTQLPRWIRSHSQKLKGNIFTYILTNNIFTDILLSWEENYRHLVVYKESQAWFLY